MSLNVQSNLARFNAVSADKFRAELETMQACVFLARAYCTSLGIDASASTDPSEVVRSVARVLGFTFTEGK